MSTVAIITTDEAFTTRLRAALQRNGAVFTMAPEQLTDLVSRSIDGPEVVVLGPGMSLDEACNLAGHIDRTRPDIATVLVADADTGVLAAALRVGVRDVVAEDTEPDELRNVVERAGATARARRVAIHVDTPKSARPVGKIVTVASPKGGCGKTTVATNLAVELGQRVPGEVVIVDLDLQFGDVASNLRLDPEHHVVDAVAAVASDDMILKTYLTSHSSGCYALCAPDSPAFADNVSGDQIRAMLQRLASGFRYVIVDTAPGLAEHTLAALEVSDKIIMLAGMDVPSIRGVHRELAILDELRVSKSSIKVLLNFVDRRSGLRVEDVETMLGTPVDFQLPRSREVPLSTNRGVPLLAEKSRDPVALRLRELADDVDVRGRQRQHLRANKRAGAAEKPRNGSSAQGRTA